MEQTFPSQDQASQNAIHEGLEKVFEVSHYLDFPFTLDEIADCFLPRVKITGQQLGSALSGHDFTDIPFQIKNGYLLTSASQSSASRSEREQMSAAKLESAAGFARMLTRLVPFIRTIAVTGSVAYGSANKWDDIDLFIVAKRNRLWLTAFMTLLLVRLTKLLGLRKPHLSPFCLSYVHDEEGFENESKRNRTNPLFARELLKAKPVAGSDAYRRILERNDWVGAFYSSSYASKLRELKPHLNGHSIDPKEDPTRLSFLVDWAEGIAFAFLSRYLKLRAYLTNLQLRSQGQNFRAFEPKISAASCVYTSNFYEWLKTLWGG